MKKGDIVQLKSGGPLMTITDIEDGYAYCKWFDKNNEVKNESFPTESLEVKK